MLWVLIDHLNYHQIPSLSALLSTVEVFKPTYEKRDLSIVQLEFFQKQPLKKVRDVDLCLKLPPGQNQQNDMSAQRSLGSAWASLCAQ